MGRGYQGGGIFLVRLVGLFLLLMLFAAVLHEARPAVGRRSIPAPPKIEETLLARLQPAFSQNRQKFFDSLYPVGTATGLAVHEVSVTAWKNDWPSNRAGDIRQLTVCYTLYWTDPLRSDGYTTIRLLFDTAAGRCLEEQVQATNAAAHTEAGEVVGYFASPLIYGALSR